MTTKNQISNEGKNLASATTIQDFLLSQLDLSPAVAEGSTMAYHEMAEIPLQKIDLVEQLEGHVGQLHELQARLRFMNREIRYLLKV